MTNIILGYMDNPEGNQALDLAIAQTRISEGRLIVVHSLRGGTHTSPEEINAARTALDEVARRLTQEGLDFEIEDYVRGNAPADDILAAANDYHADLIVIGYERRTAAGKLLLGSKALQVMIDAPCPVLGVASP
jgi:nucleotide-binding universal stress UspA family protein